MFHDTDHTDRAGRFDHFYPPMVLVTMPARMDMGSCFPRSQSVENCKVALPLDPTLMRMTVAVNMHALTPPRIYLMCPLQIHSTACVHTQHGPCSVCTAQPARAGDYVGNMHACMHAKHRQGRRSGTQGEPCHMCRRRQETTNLQTTSPAWPSSSRGRALRQWAWRRYATAWIMLSPATIYRRHTKTD